VSVEYQVTPQYLADAAADCHTVAGEIQGELTALKTFVDGLGAIYLGLASDKFQQMMVDFQAYANNLHTSLEDIGSGLQGNFVNYVEMEQANLATVAAFDDLNLPMNLAPVPTGSTAAPGDITSTGT
jgi:WXG100 family type VII secretion target